MTNGHTVTIAPADLHVEVWVDGVQLAETDHPLLLDETGLPTRYYLPRADVHMDLLRKTGFSTTCPFKGDASYWSYEAHDGIVWSYESPIPAAADIAGYLCFYPDRVDLKVG